MADPVPPRALPLLALALPVLSQTVGHPSLPVQLMEPGARVEWVAKVKASCDAPTYDKAAGVLYFTEARGANVPHWPIWKVDLNLSGAPAAVFHAQSEQGRGLGFDPDGRLVAAQKGKLIRLTAAGTWETIAASGRTAVFDEVNDFAFDGAGGLYFTGRDARVYYREPGGDVSIAYGGLQGGNGIVFAGEKALLYVNDILAARTLAFPVLGPGRLGQPRELLRATRPDGLSLDELGNFYVANNTDGIVHVFDPDAREIGTIRMTPPADYDVCSGGRCNATHAKFGGPDGRTLFITGDGGVFSLRLKVRGREAGPATGLRFRPAGYPASPAKTPATRAAFDALARRLDAAKARPGWAWHLPR